MTSVVQQGFVTAMSICPSFNGQSSVGCSQFQLSLVTTVSRAFVLYCLGMADIQFVKRHILLSFEKIVAYCYRNCIPLDFRSQGTMYQLNVNHLEFKMADTEIVHKCNWTNFSKSFCMNCFLLDL